MQQPQTLTEALKRFQAEGFVERFRPHPDGLHALDAGALLRPESMVIRGVRRFEDEVDPGDQAILFALECRETRLRGTCTVTYGPRMCPDEARVVQRLPKACPRDLDGGGPISASRPEKSSGRASA